MTFWGILGVAAAVAVVLLMLHVVAALFMPRSRESGTDAVRTESGRPDAADPGGQRPVCVREEGPADRDRSVGPGTAKSDGGSRVRQIPSVDMESEPVSADTSSAVGDADWEANQVIEDRYEVRGLLGKGGMGAVYRVRHLTWQIDLAVKSPLAEYFQSEGDVQAFDDECKTWVDLGLHPHTVSCYYTRRIDGVPCVFVELVEGGSLLDWIRDGRLHAGGADTALLRILDIAIQMAWGLEHAHGRDVVHQDVKPANVLMTPDGTAKLTDFGLAKARTVIEADKPSGIDPLVSFRGMTPAYCSPEQQGRQRLSYRTDVWSWAVSVLHMFTGNLDWQGPEARSALQARTEHPVTDPDRPRLPSALVELLANCLETAPDARPHSMQYVADQAREIWAEVAGRRFPREAPQSIDLVADSKNNKALTLFDLDDPDGAKTLWKEARNEQPNHVASTYNHELTTWREGRQTDVGAVARLESLSVDGENIARAAFLRGQLLLEAGDAAGAVASLQDATQRETDTAEYWALLGKALLMNSRTEEAFSALERAHALAPFDSSVKRLLDRLKSDNDECTAWARHAWHEVDFADSFIAGHPCLAFEPDTQTVVVRTQRGFAAGAALSTGPACEFGNDEFPDVSNVAVDRDATKVAMLVREYPQDKRVVVWSLETGQQIRTIPAAKLDSYTRLLVSTDGSVFGKHDFFDDGKPEPLCVAPSDRDEFIPLCGGVRGLKRMALDPKGEWLATVYREEFRIWSVSTGFGEWLLRNPQLGPIWSDFSKDGDLILTCSLDGTARVWQVANETDMTVLWSYQTHPDFPCTAAINERKDLIATWNRMTSTNRDADATEQICVLDTATGRRMRTISDVETKYDPRLAFSSDSRLLFAFSTEGGLRAWHIPDRCLPAALEVSRPRASITIGTASQRAEQLITLAREALEQREYRSAFEHIRAVQQDEDFTFDRRAVDLLRILHRVGRRLGIRHVRCLSVLTAVNGGPVTALRFVDPSHALSGTAHGDVELWNLPGSKSVAQLHGHSNEIRLIVPAASAPIAVTIDERRNVRAWDLDNRTCVALFEYRWIGAQDTDCFRTLAVSGDGTRAFSTGAGRHAVVWDLEIEEAASPFEIDVDQDPLRALFVDDDNSRILLELEDLSWRLLELPTRQCRHVAPPKTPDSGLPRAIANGESVMLEDPASGETLSVLQGHGQTVLCCDVCADARYALSGDEAGEIRLWELDWDLEFSGPSIKMHDLPASEAE